MWDEGDTELFYMISIVIIACGFATAYFATRALY